MSDQLLAFSNLNPDLILDAIDSLGLQSDGRLLALNSYENRVYQVGIEDAQPLVAKFYRPMRWSDAAILEEHTFIQSLFEAEVPAVPAIALQHHQTLYSFKDYRFSLFKKHGGRAPDLDQPGVLEWIGRFIGRIHAIGALHPFEHRPTLDIESFGREPSQFLLEHQFIPTELLEVYPRRNSASVGRSSALF